MPQVGLGDETVKVRSCQVSLAMFFHFILIPTSVAFIDQSDLTLISFDLIQGNDQFDGPTQLQS